MVYTTRRIGENPFESAALQSLVDTGGGWVELNQRRRRRISENLAEFSIFFTKFFRERCLLRAARRLLHQPCGNVAEFWALSIIQSR
jgi:hypothetical protein